MSSPDDPKKPPHEAAHARLQTEAGRVADARAALAAIDRGVFANRRKPTREEHGKRFARAAARLFGDG